jgi:hypothetical protein
LFSSSIWHLGQSSIRLFGSSFNVISFFTGTT